jgi:two-component system, NarL family, nitrate/nitrite response regulator NarL
MKIRILLIDDHALFRDSVARLLADEPDFEIVGTCGTLDEAIAVLSSRPADIVLLDLDLGGRRGAGFFERAAGIQFRGQVLIVTAAASDLDAVELVRHGASGIFLKESPPALLAKSIRQVMSGEPWLNQRYLKAVVEALDPPPPPEKPKPPFTRREREVLQGVMEGLSNKEIAGRLQTTESAVKSVVQQLFVKTGVHSRSQLVRVALESPAGDVH